MQNRKKVTPIYVFDEHNEAYYYWHKAKYEGYINEPLDLFHIDAHSDMMKTDCIQSSIYFPEDSQVGYLEYYKNIAKNEFNIGNFIIPAILNGLIKNVYFIFPKWMECKPKRKKYNISSMFGEGKIFKHCLTINKNTNPKLFQVLPDFKQYNFSFLPIDRLPKARKVILDIDLDYFACSDSHNTNKKGEHESKSYLPSKLEIVSEIDRLITTLKIKKIRPLVVTISRSCVSGFCPKDYAEFIEPELLQRMQLLFEK